MNKTLFVTMVIGVLAIAMITSALINSDVSAKKSISVKRGANGSNGANGEQWP